MTTASVAWVGVSPKEMRRASSVGRRRCCCFSTRTRTQGPEKKRSKGCSSGTTKVTRNDDPAPSRILITMVRLSWASPRTAASSARSRASNRSGFRAVSRPSLSWRRSSPDESNSRATALVDRICRPSPTARKAIPRASVAAFAVVGCGIPRQYRFDSM